MKELSFVIMELLAISLGVDRLHYRKFFEDGGPIMRCNYYPPCNSSSLTLGTGPHSDPTSLTILHQDQVGGLEVCTDNKWLAVRPRPEAFVINLGDTFMVRTLITGQFFNLQTKLQFPSAEFLKLHIYSLFLFLKNIFSFLVFIKYTIFQSDLYFLFGGTYYSYFF